MSRNIFNCHDWQYPTGIYEIEAKNAAKYFIMHRTLCCGQPSTTKNYSVQNVSCAKIKNPLSQMREELGSTMEVIEFQLSYSNPKR